MPSSGTPAAWTRAWPGGRPRPAPRFPPLLAGRPLALPRGRPPAVHVYHHYAVRSPKRDALAKALVELGVGTALHYPLPIPGQPLFRSGGALATEAEGPHAWQAPRGAPAPPGVP